MRELMRGVSRRESFKLGGASVAAALLTGCAATNNSPAGANGRAVRNGRNGPKNIIFMVSDGMSTGTLSLADPFSRIARGPDHGTHWARMMRRPDVTNGLEETYSLNSLVTDSAAAASAWGSGSRINNGPLNVLPDGTRLTPIADLVKDSGRRVALVTTTTMTHATPAGFAAVQESRGQEDDIAPQYLGKVDVLFGGGRPRFEAAHRADARDLGGDYERAGYAVWTHRSELMAGNRPPRMLGLFGPGHLPYTLDRMHSAQHSETVPTLAEMTRAALEALVATGDGFLMQVEGGRVDHAAHGSDAAALLWDQLAFDDAIGVAMEFAERRGDTLVVVTSDHGNSNPALNGLGGRTNSALELLARSTASFDVLRRRMREAAGEGNQPDAALISDIIRTHCEIEISAEHAEVLAATYAEPNPNELNAQLNNFNGAMAQVLGNHTGIQFTGRSHTADYVQCSAFGPGRERFAGLRPNTDSFRQMTQLFDIDFTNPSMKPEEAWRHVRVDPVAAEHVEA